MRFTVSVFALVCLFFAASLSSHASNGKKPRKRKKVRAYKLNSTVKDFKLINAADGKMVALSNSEYADAKGFILIFLSNNCPTTQLYTERLIALQEKYAHKGYPVIAINPYNSVFHPKESLEAAGKVVARKQLNFPYLVNGHKVAQKFGAIKTPQVFVLQRSGKRLKIRYIGAIDNKPRLPKYNNTRYTERAVNQLIGGRKVHRKVTRPLGTTIDYYTPAKSDELISRK
ncbi:MAG TPA: thioredoxin family protein [Microscillaceae bacterium]|nr:thioredoxin family protein [Microscillaceae bacterium]